VIVTRQRSAGATAPPVLDRAETMHYILVAKRSDLVLQCLRRPEKLGKLVFDLRDPSLRALPQSAKCIKPTVELGQHRRDRLPNTLQVARDLKRFLAHTSNLATSTSVIG
jgi:hypothetical protein